MNCKMILWGLSAWALISCNNAGTDSNHADSTKTNQTANYKANMNEVYRAIETGDVSKLDSFIAPDFIDHEGDMGKDIVGRDSVKAFLANIHNYFDNMDVEVMSQAVSEDGNYVFSMVRMTGTAKENPWGMPVGMTMDDMGVDVVRMQNGMAKEHWSFTSQKDILEMMNMSGGQNTAGQQ